MSKRNSGLDRIGSLSIAPRVARSGTVTSNDTEAASGAFDIRPLIGAQPTRKAQRTAAMPRDAEDSGTAVGFRGLTPVSSKGPAPHGPGDGGVVDLKNHDRRHRITVYFQPAVVRRLFEHCARANEDFGRVIADAVAAYLDKRRA